MGDRGEIQFKQYGRVEAAIYTHWHGSEAQKELIEFFQTFCTANEAASRDTRYDDASYLAARFVGHVMRLDPYGLGWGIVQPGTSDASSVWVVDCDNLVGPDQRPSVTRQR